MLPAERCGPRDIGPGVDNPTSSRRVVLLLTLVVFINYVDRGSLSTALPLIERELGLTPSQLGIVLSAFYYGYVVMMAPAGWFAERFGAPVVLTAGVITWSLATLFTGLASTFVALLVLRLLLGVGESVAFPCASKALAQTVSIDRLGSANGVLSFGYLLGPAAGTLVGGLLMDSVGWRPVFVLFGLLSLAWIIPWRRVVISPASAPVQISSVQPSLGTIARQRGLWSAGVGLFCTNYSFYFIIAWLPFYLVQARGFSINSMVWTASWAYLLTAVSALLAGWLTDRWSRTGRSVSVIHKVIMAAFTVGGILCMTAMTVLPAWGLIAALFVYQVLAGLSSPTVLAVPQIFAGPHASGRWVGLQNAIGAAAGLVAPAATGFIVDSTGQFTFAFLVAGVANVLGFLGWVLLMPKIEPVQWLEHRS
jgi:MFS family permease